MGTAMQKKEKWTHCNHCRMFLQHVLVTTKAPYWTIIQRCLHERGLFYCNFFTWEVFVHPCKMDPWKMNFLYILLVFPPEWSQQAWRMNFYLQLSSLFFWPTQEDKFFFKEALFLDFFSIFWVSSHSLHSSCAKCSSLTPPKHYSFERNLI